MIFRGDYEMSAAMEAINKETITQMPPSKPTLNSQSTIGLMASKKQLTRTPSISTVVAGFS